MSLSSGTINSEPFRLPSGVIKRSRLLNRLHSCVDQKLVVVTAGAGYGKTTLLAQFCEEIDFPACWISLTPWNREPVAFVEGLVKSIQKHFSSFGHATLAALNSVGRSEQDAQSFARVFLNDLEQNVHDYFLLMLDDFHQMDEAVWITSFVSELIPHMPEQLHLILTSRTKPRIKGLSRLVVNREAILLSPQELRFTSDEAKELLDRHFQMSLSEDEAAQINDQCEGWPAALILAGQGNHGDLPTNQDVILLEYLEEELFARQSDSLKSFLLKTSVFPTMRIELCDSLLGVNDSQSRLEELVRLNLASLEIVDNRPMYRYHSLFRQFLYNKLTKESKGDANNIGRAAGLCLEESELWQEALEVYCHAGTYDIAAKMLMPVCKNLAVQSRWLLIIHALDMLPMDYLLSIPELALRKIEALSRQGNPNEALRLLDILIPRLLPEIERNYLSWALLEKSIALRSEGDIGKAESYCQEALSLLTSSHTQEYSLILARAHHNLALAKAISRDFPLAIEHFNEALEVYEWLEDVKMASQIQGHLGTVYTELGDLKQGVFHLNEALRGFHLIGDDWGIVTTLTSLGTTYTFMAEYELAEEILTQAASRASSLKMPLDEAYALAALADAKRLGKRYTDAQTAYDRATELAKNSSDARLIISSLEGHALTFLETGEPSKSRALVEEAFAFAEQDGLEWQKGTLLITRATIARCTGNIEQAKENLEQAMVLLSDRSTPLEQCRTRLHLAYVHNILGQEREAAWELRVISEFLAGRSDPFFLIPDLLQLPGLLEFASRMERGGDVYRMLSNKAEQVRLRSIVQNDEPSEEYDEVQEGTVYPSIGAQGFGTSVVWLDGEEVSSSKWRSNKAKELFFYLAYQARRVTKEEIIAALWPDTDYERAESAFKSNLFRARRALYPECFSHENGYYEFTPMGKFQFDVPEFTRLMEIAERLPDGAGLRSRYMEEAIALYKGSFLPEFYSEWIDSERDGLAYQHVQSMFALAELHANEEDYERAAHLNEKILDVDPYNEQAVKGAMIRFSKAGNFSAASTCYRRYKQVLKKDLGTVPSVEMKNLYHSISHSLSVS